jgi:RNA polymerase sigma-70 factor (ECF subfamily)
VVATTYAPRVSDRALLYREALGFADGLYNTARRLTGDDDAAEELVQETYARAVAGLDGFVPGSNLRAWMFRILRNAHIDQLRRRRADPTTREVEVTDEVPGPDPGALARLGAREVEAALAELPVASREVILLDLEGLTEAETAEVLGVPVGTVKSRLSRARAALRERLKDHAR